MNIFDNNKVKRMRIEKKLTIDNIAATLGIESSALAQYERGITEPDKEIVEKLAAILGCAFQELIRFNVVIVEKSPMDYNEITALETMLLKIGDVSLLSPEQAQSFLRDLCQLAVPILMNQIEYQPINFSVVPYESNENVSLKNAERIVDTIKTIMHDLSKKNPYKGMPLMHNSTMR